MEFRIEKQNISENKYVIHFDHTKSVYNLLRKKEG